jgi:hypothetical protein
VDGIGNIENSKDPLTGWNHNLPSPNSPFWTETREKRSGQQRVASSSSSVRRTGWLHNTQPAAQKRTAASGGVDLARRRLELAMTQQQNNHRMMAPPAFHGCGSTNGVVAVTEHLISVPLQYASNSSNQRMDVAFTIVEAIQDEDHRTWLELLQSMKLTPQQRALHYVTKAGLTTAASMILFLQGGPGFGSPTPMVNLGFSSATASWASQALLSAPTSSMYQRVVLMDQRGTGRSSPITKQTLEMKFPDLFLLDAVAPSSLEEHVAEQPNDEERQRVASKVREAVKQAVDYLSHMRADSIVQDAEFIKEALMVPPSLEQGAESSTSVASPNPWGCCLGQSYGGFCTVTYLSQIPFPPKVCLLTGGIPPILTPLSDLYTTLWRRVRQRSLLYYEQYPGDVTVVKKIVRRLLDRPPVRLPSGGTLTARRFLQLGLALGSSPSTFASLHALFSSAFVDDNNEAFSRSFLKQVDTQQSFDDHPIYFWLHESIYADARCMPENNPTDWAAHRAYEDLLSENSKFDYRHTCQSALPDEPVLFFGEMVFPWMVQDYAELSGVGLREMAHRLSQKSDWGPLYDTDMMAAALADGRSRVAMACYHDDLYVDFDASMKVASGPLSKAKIYVTNEYQHSGLRDDGATIFAKLHGMAMGSVRTPS